MSTFDFPKALMSFLSSQKGRTELKEEPVEVVIGEELVIDARIVEMCELFKTECTQKGISLVVRQAPSWLLNLRRELHVTVDGQDWTIKLTSSKRTYICVDKRHLHIDIRRTPSPSFIDTRSSKCGFVETVQAVVAEINASLPLWKAALSEQELAVDARRTEFKTTEKPQLGQETPLRILHRPTKQISMLKTKLASAPDWLFAHGYAEFHFEGHIWRCKLTNSRTYIDVRKRKFNIGHDNTGGYTSDMIAERLDAFCAAFNKQRDSAHTSGIEFRHRKDAFKTATFSAGDRMSVVVLQKAVPCIRLVQAPKWLSESGKTFRFRFLDDVWECEFHREEPVLNAEQRKIKFAENSAPFKSHLLSLSEVGMLFGTINECLPEWRSALDQHQVESREKRIAEFQRSGFIKRQRLIDAARVEELLEHFATE